MYSNSALFTPIYQHLTDALEKISGQAVCVNMDGDDGNERMLKNILEIADNALTQARTAMASEQSARLKEDMTKELEQALNDCVNVLLESNMKNDNAVAASCIILERRRKLASVHPD